MDPALVSILSSWMDTFKNTFLSVLPWVLPLATALLGIKLGIQLAIKYFVWLTDGRYADAMKTDWGKDEGKVWASPLPKTSFFHRPYNARVDDLYDDDDPRAPWNQKNT